jgi:hypothetical protein
MQKGGFARFARLPVRDTESDCANHSDDNRSCTYVHVASESCAWVNGVVNILLDHPRLDVRREPVICDRYIASGLVYRRARLLLDAEMRQQAQSQRRGPPMAATNRRTEISSSTQLRAARAAETSSEIAKT